MYLVGLTGGVATGKSTVSNMFRELGVPVIDADAMARRIVEPGRKAWRAIKYVVMEFWKLTRLIILKLCIRLIIRTSTFNID